MSENPDMGHPDPQFHPNFIHPWVGFAGDGLLRSKGGPYFGGALGVGDEQQRLRIIDELTVEWARRIEAQFWIGAGIVLFERRWLIVWIGLPFNGV
jgi:hypothetical protein